MQRLRQCVKKSTRGYPAAAKLKIRFCPVGLPPLTSIAPWLPPRAVVAATNIRMGEAFADQNGAHVPPADRERPT
jgi:hypothetical protein